MTKTITDKHLPHVLPPWHAKRSVKLEIDARLKLWIQQPSDSEVGLKHVLTSFIDLYSDGAFDELVAERDLLISEAKAKLAQLPEEAVFTSFDNRGYMASHPVYDLLLKLQQTEFPYPDSLNYVQQVMFLILKYHQYMFSSQNRHDLLYRACQPSRDLILGLPVAINFKQLVCDVGSSVWIKKVETLAQSFSSDSDDDLNHTRQYLTAGIKPYLGFKDFYDRKPHQRVQLEPRWRKGDTTRWQNERNESISDFSDDAKVQNWVDRGTKTRDSFNIPESDYAEQQTLITKPAISSRDYDSLKVKPCLAALFDPRRQAMQRKAANDAIMANNVTRTLGHPALSYFQQASFVQFLQEVIERPDEDNTAQASAIAFWSLKLFTGQADNTLKAIWLFADNEAYGAQLCLIKKRKQLYVQFPLSSPGRNSNKMQYLQVKLPTWLNNLVMPFAKTRLKLGLQEVLLFSTHDADNPARANTDFSTARRSLLEQFNKQFDYQSITAKQLENWLPDALNTQDEFNRTEASYITGNGISGRQIPRYYLATSVHRIEDLYYSFWSGVTEKLNQEIVANGLGPTLKAFQQANLTFEFDEPDTVGSQRQLDEKQLKLLADGLQQQIKIQRSKQDWIRHHNSYALYTLLFLQLNSGLRAINQPLPSFLHIDFNQKRIFIADKAANNVARGRILPLSNAVITQLIAFKSHLQTLHNRLAILNTDLSYLSECSDNYPLADLSQIRPRQSKVSDYDQPFLFFLNDKYEAVQITHERIKALLPADAQEFARNFGRHLFFNRLVEQGLSDEQLSILMGHSEHGESTHALYSTAISETLCLRQPLEQLADEYAHNGWYPITAEAKAIKAPSNAG